MHIAEAGNPDAPPVLLLHGFPQHWWEWRKVILPLAERYRVVAPDLRGAGWTDAPADGYTVDQVLADVLALLDKLALRRVGLVAHDFSAFVGFRLCFDHPERVARLSVPRPAPLPAFQALLDMESTSARTRVLPRSGRSAIGIRRHLERISCGIRPDQASREARKPLDPRVNPGVSANDGDQTS